MTTTTNMTREDWEAKRAALERDVEASRWDAPSVYRAACRALDAHTRSEPPPASSDVRAWDAYRARVGYSGCHH